MEEPDDANEAALGRPEYSVEARQHRREKVRCFSKNCERLAAFSFLVGAFLLAHQGLFGAFEHPFSFPIRSSPC
jgi:hypothetical protein